MLTYGNGIVTFFLLYMSQRKLLAKTCLSYSPQKQVASVDRLIVDNFDILKNIVFDFFILIYYFLEKVEFPHVY